MLQSPDYVKFGYMAENQRFAWTYIGNMKIEILFLALDLYERVILV